MTKLTVKGSEARHIERRLKHKKIVNFNIKSDSKQETLKNGELKARNVKNRI